MENGLGCARGENVSGCSVVGGGLTFPPFIVQSIEVIHVCIFLFSFLFFNELIMGLQETKPQLDTVTLKPNLY